MRIGPPHAPRDRSDEPVRELVDLVCTGPPQPARRGVPGAGDGDGAGPAGRVHGEDLAGPDVDENSSSSSWPETTSGWQGTQLSRIALVEYDVRRGMRMQGYTAHARSGVPDAGRAPRTRTTPTRRRRRAATGWRQRWTGRGSERAACGGRHPPSVPTPRPSPSASCAGSSTIGLARHLAPALDGASHRPDRRPRRRAGGGCGDRTLSCLPREVIPADVRAASRRAAVTDAYEGSFLGSDSTNAPSK
jgi:hypothetical protein